MKKITLFTLLTMLHISFGCSNDSANPVIVNTEIIGEWNWIESSGGFTGASETPESTGNTKSLIISNTSVKRFVNGTLTSESPYTIEVQPSIFGGTSQMLIFPEGMKQSFEVANGILHIHDEFPDGYSSTYESL